MTDNPFPLRSEAAKPSIPQLAAHLCMSAETFREFRERARLPRFPSLDEAREAYIGYLKDIAAGKGFSDKGAETLGSIKLQLEKARVLKLEMANARYKGDLLDAKEVEHQWNTILMALRTKLLSFPNSLAPTLAACKDFAEVKQILELAVNDTLQDMADFSSDDYSREAVADDTIQTEQPDAKKPKQKKPAKRK